MIFIKCIVFYTVFAFGYEGEKAFDSMVEKLTKNLSAPQITSTFLKKDLNKKLISNLKRKKDVENFSILDARENEEFKISHIPGATLVGYKNFSLKKTLKIIPKNQKVVVYCSVGYRSGKIVEKLRENGVEAYNLRGGIFGWANSGNELVDANEKKTQKIHGYNKTWSKWIKGRESVL
jgi:rhodanese-related sulfurtransferase